MTEAGVGTAAPSFPIPSITQPLRFHLSHKSDRVLTFEWEKASIVARHHPNLARTTCEVTFHMLNLG